MKKYIVSTFVIFTFAVYALYQHIVGVGDLAVANNNVSDPTANVIVADNTNSNSQTPTDTPTPSVVPTKVITKVTTSVPVHTKVTPVVPVAPKPTPVKVITNTGMYKDGQYTGVSADAYYGNIQVEATISGGRLTDVQFLDHPQDRGTSIRINNRAMPILRQEAIQAQSGNVSIVSGATDSSGAFRQSMTSALNQALNS